MNLFDGDPAWLETPIIRSAVVVIVAAVLVGVIVRVVKRALHSRIHDNTVRYRASRRRPRLATWS